MSNTPNLNTVFSTGALEAALHDAASTAISDRARPAAPPPTTTGGTPRMSGAANVRAGELRDLTAQNTILRNITGADAELAVKNFELLKTRLGDGFTKILSSPGVADMVRGVKLENNLSTQSTQDAAAAKRLADASAVPMPANVKRGEFGAAPLDIMPYVNLKSGKFAATILEMNGTGYGNITTMEKNMLSLTMQAMGDVAAVLEKEPNALFVIGCSGREDPPAFGQSKKIHEKLMIAHAMDKAIRQHQLPGLMAEAMTEDGGASNPKPSGGARIIGLDSFDADALERNSKGEVVIENSVAKEKPGRDKDGIANLNKTLDNLGDWHDPKQPAIVVGYTSQLAKAITIGADGTPYLNGRKVSVINNDRLVLNINSLNASQGRKLDTGKFTSSNKSYLPAASKGHAYAFANQYNQRPDIAAQFPQFSREIVNEQAHSVQEIHEKVLALLEQGKRVIIKPHGTGHGVGIRAFDTPERKAPAKILAEIEESLAQVKGTYGDRGGLPYTISEYLTAARIDKPGHPLHTMKYELRIPVFADVTDPENRTLKATHGAIIKIDSGSALKDGESGDFSKSFASVSAQVLATGLSADNFMKPLADPETLDLLGLTEKDIGPLLKWASGYVAHTLENIDQAETLLDKK